MISRAQRPALAMRCARDLVVDPSAAVVQDADVLLKQHDVPTILALPLTR